MLYARRCKTHAFFIVLYAKRCQTQFCLHCIVCRMLQNKYFFVVLYSKRCNTAACPLCGIPNAIKPCFSLYCMPSYVKPMIVHCVVRKAIRNQCLFFHCIVCQVLQTQCFVCHCVVHCMLQTMRCHCIECQMLQKRCFVLCISPNNACISYSQHSAHHTRHTTSQHNLTLRWSC